VTDSAGYPVDGAQVTIARKVDGITYLESTWGSTDHTGRCRFQLGDGQYVYARIDSDLGTVPPGPLYKLVVGPTVAGQHYLWQKTVPNLRPALPAEPGGPPVGQAAEYQVLVDWEVSDQFVYGSNRIDDNTFSDHLPLGALTSFVCDQAGYDAYLTWQPFLAYNLMRDSTSGSLTFEIPPGDDHYVVFSNQEHVASAQVVRGVAKLYYRSMAAVAGGSVRSAEVSLGQVRPNPVAGETAILFSLPADAVADLSIYDVEGRWVNTLASGLTSAGEHRVCWDGRDSLGRRVAPGIYVCRLDSPRGRVSRKMVVVE
jgi:hypothetical protein